MRSKLVRHTFDSVDSLGPGVNKSREQLLILFAAVPIYQWSWTHGRGRYISLISSKLLGSMLATRSTILPHRCTIIAIMMQVSMPLLLSSQHNHC